MKDKLIIKNIQMYLNERLKKEERFLDFLFDELDLHKIKEDDDHITETMSRINLMKYIIDDVKFLVGDEQDGI